MQSLLQIRCWPHLVGNTLLYGTKKEQLLYNKKIYIRKRKDVKKNKWAQ
jgi:hypothetical protein